MRGRLFPRVSSPQAGVPDAKEKWGPLSNFEMRVWMMNTARWEGITQWAAENMCIITGSADSGQPALIWNGVNLDSRIKAS
jgi:hypothetical protein